MASSMRWKAAGSVISAMRSHTEPGSPSLWERLRAVPRLVSAVLKGSYTQTSLGRVALWIGALLYVVSPVDLIPDLLPMFIGLGDDAVVIAWLAATMSTEAADFIQWEEERSRTIPGETIPPL